jgi:hypothetical protein
MSPKRRTRSVHAAVALFGLALRILIPVGFDPAHGSFGLVLCPDGFPPGFFAISTDPRAAAGAPHPGGSPAHSSPCIFCNSSSPGPVSLTGVLALRMVLVALPVVVPFVPGPTGIRLVHTPQPRAPPLPV